MKNHPFSYPTHSVSGVVEVMRSKPVKVCAFGQKNTNNDPHFANSDFSNMTALFQMENGAAFRVSEMREICDGLGLRGEDFRIFGTRGSYSYAQWRNNGRVEPTPEPKAVELKELTDEDLMFTRRTRPWDMHLFFHKTVHVYYWKILWYNL